MRIGVCGIACEVCPRRMKGSCPNGEEGCRPKENLFYAIADCAFRRKETFCFACAEFPCESTAKGPVSPGYCLYISGKEDP
jgi:hypothetical protein